MQERHSNKLLYLEEQIVTTEKYVIPYLSDHIEINSNISVLEIGCGEGGNLKPFIDMGCSVTGIDMSKNKIEVARKYFKTDINSTDKINFICEDIYNITDFKKYDLIFMRDVIEHIPDQNRFMKFVKNFMHENTIFFLAFPPWQNPFGGHQQTCRNKITSKTPYIHLFPTPIYRGILSFCGEKKNVIDALVDIKDTGITIERFERILSNNDFNIVKKDLYVINPNYEVKFKLKPRKQSALVASIPWLRNFVSTAAYYIVTKNN